ncbi:macro domain-like protein [Gymnopilus junonius]|uniref:Macro domain-like protein n=1 Tax=Gymnopilus junonius TaxID=109634 RepID=A0A9P5NLF5_GYMJU|nr:macro domain-like protein [Gymnopilus junonius]
MDNLHFILLDRSGILVEEWKIAFAEHVPEAIRDKFKMVTSNLSDLEGDDKQFDCIVSPANSYALLDGGFDYFLAEALSPDDVPAVTKHAQSILYSKWRGYAPPGSCTLIELEGSTFQDNVHQCSYIALCPTMRVPSSATWNREVIYNIMWSLLVTLDQHNSNAQGKPILKVLTTGLGTGVGNISAGKCAQQMALAVRDFVEACANPQKWSSLKWEDAKKYADDGHRTHRL